MVLMSSFSGQQWRNRHRKQTYGPGEAEEGEGRMYGESNIGIYNTTCKTDSRWEFSVLPQGTQTGALGQVEG